MRTFAFIILILGCPIWVAQNSTSIKSTLHGTVVDEWGQPLPSANISVDDTSMTQTRMKATGRQPVATDRLLYLQNEDAHNQHIYQPG